MADEKKYSVIGEVKIGTDEYRDLIEAVANNRHEADEYRSKYWSEQTKAENLKKEVDKLRRQLEVFNAFMRTDNNIFMAYAAFCQSTADNNGSNN